MIRTAAVRSLIHSNVSLNSSLEEVYQDCLSFKMSCAAWGESSWINTVGLKKTHSIFYFQKHDKKSQDSLIQTTCHESTFSADKPSRESPGWAKGYWKSLVGGQSLKFSTINFP